MRAYKRADRVGRLVSQIVAERLVRGSSDNRLQGIVVTGVDMSPDLKIATIRYHLISPDPGDRDRARDGLAAARRHLQEELRRQMVIKYIPRLRFQYDEGLEHAERIEAVLQELNAERNED